MEKKFTLFIAFAIFAMASCSKDDDEDGIKSKLNKTDITLYVDDTEKLIYSGTKCTWKSDNPLIASIEDGVVTGEHVGVTKVHANELSCTVTVKPKYNNFFEPLLEWGASPSRIKNYMSGYKLKTSTTDQITFDGKGNTLGYIYLLNSNKLSSSALLVNIFNASSLTDFLLERYVVIDAEQTSNSQYEFTMANVDMNMAVYVIINNSSMFVAYYGVSKSSNSPIRQIKKELLR